MAAQIASLLAALLLLDASITFENVWPTPAIRWTGELSLELAICVFVLSLVAAARPRADVPSPRTRLTFWLAALWVALAIGRYADVTAPALYGREVNLYWDLRFMPDVIAMVTTVARAGMVAASIAVALLAVVILFLAMRWAWNQVWRAMIGPRARRQLGVIALALIGIFVVHRYTRLLGARPNAFAAPVTPTYARQARFALEALLERSPLPASPRMDSSLAAVKGADVWLVFIEAYGRVAFARPDISRMLAPSRDTLLAAVRDTHRGVVSAFVESPTFGGSSWLAHISLMSGVLVRDPGTNARLLTERRDTLPRVFERAGYRTVALMPGLRQSWPEGSFYGFDDIYGAERLAYRGPEFGWFAIPDEYAVQRLDALEVAHARRPPLFVFFPTISTHFPFSPTPPYQPDWTRMTDPHPYDGPAIVRAYAREPDWVNFAPGYVDALTYDFTTFAGYLRLRADRDLVLILIGDHEPAAAVSGEHASWDVPVHVVASRPEVLERLKGHGFVEGLAPSESLGPMNALTPILLDAFGSPAKQP